MLNSSQIDEYFWRFFLQTVSERGRHRERDGRIAYIFPDMEGGKTWKRKNDTRHLTNLWFYLFEDRMNFVPSRIVSHLKNHALIFSTNIIRIRWLCITLMRIRIWNCCLFIESAMAAKICITSPHIHTSTFQAFAVHCSAYARFRVTAYLCCWQGNVGYQ